MKTITFITVATIIIFITFPKAVFASDIIGNIPLPEPLAGAGYGSLLTWAQGKGPIGFASNLIKLIMIISGILAFINIVLAGFSYVTSQGNAEAVTRANQQIYWSLIGLVVVIGSFVLAAILGWLLFGDASAILSPKIYGPRL